MQDRAENHPCLTKEVTDSTRRLEKEVKAKEEEENEEAAKQAKRQGKPWPPVEDESQKISVTSRVQTASRA